MQIIIKCCSTWSALKAYRNIDVAVPREIEHRLSNAILIWSVGLCGGRRSVSVLLLKDSVVEELIFFEVLKWFADKPLCLSSSHTHTHKFDGETSVLIRIFLDPEILEEVECTLVGIVLSMVSKQTVANESVRPEARDSGNNLPALFIHRLQSGLSLTF
jgi:hypothetical protein